MRIISTLPVLAVAVAAQSTAGPYGQCGGNGYTGPTGCGSGYTCTTYNPYYAQCYPGVATPTSTTSTTSRTSAITTTTTTPNTLSTITTTKSSSSSSTGSPIGSVPTTLVNGYYWIRAVAPPNYHLYLQSSSPLSPGKALINTHTSAGQFQLTTDGQLVYYRGTSARPLYLNIENPTNKTQRKLQTEFKETKNSYGNFAFQGDTLTWSVADISRPNTAAWLVCAGQELFVNTGAYGYDTPAGCADQTIHSYGGSTADL